MPAVPTKAYDVRQGNQSVDSDSTVYPRATLIVFRDNAAKEMVIEAFAKLGSYQETINGQPNPQSKQGFFNSELQAFIKERVRDARSRTAHEAVSIDASDLP